MKKVYRPVPCPSYDLEQLESWLTDQAAKGLHLTAINWLGLFVFEKAESRDARYRLEANQTRPSLLNRSNTPSTDLQEMARDLGWEFAAQYGDFFIFRCGNPEAPELNTDPEIQALTIRALTRRCVTNLLWMVVYLAVFTLVLAPGFFYHMATYGSLLLISLCLFLAMDLIQRTLALYRISRFQRRLLSGSELRRNKDWKRKSLFQHLRQTITVVLFVAFLCSWGAFTAASAKHPLEEYPGTPPFVTLEELVPADEAVYFNKISNGYYMTSTDPLIPVIIQWLDGGQVSYPDQSSTGGLLQVRYCETAAPWIARAIAKDYLDYYRFRYDSGPQELTGLDADYAAGYRTEYGTATAVLAEGSTVVCIDFSISDSNGNFTIENWLSLMAQKLT